MSTQIPEGRTIVSLTLIAVLMIGRAASTQTTVEGQAANQIFRLDAGETTYAFGLNEKSQIQTIYWGARLSAQDAFASPRSAREAASFDGPPNTTPQEYAGWGTGLYVEPALKISFANGNRDLDLRYVSNKTDVGSIDLTLKDIVENVYVTLHYSIDPATGIIGRSSTITNRTNQTIVVDQAAAATWNLPRGDDYTLRYLTGRWAAEWQLQQQKVRPGATVLESRRGSTGHQNNPWFALERGDGGKEEDGMVWFGALAWSGSWRITVEQDQLRQVRVTGGYNPYDFGYKLAPVRSWRHQSFTEGIPEKESAKHPDCYTVSSWQAFCPRRRM